MAQKEFYFPSNSSSYNTAYGAFRFRIYYEDTTTSSTNINAGLKRIGDLDIPFSVNGEENRLSQMTLTFSNDDNVFETNDIINPANKRNTFVDVIKDGNLFYRGMLIHDGVEKSKFFRSGSSIKYSEIKLKIQDAIKYFWFNDKTLSDISYSDNISLKTLLETAFTTYLGVAAADVYFDTQIAAISEACGNNYNITDYNIRGRQSTELISSFLSELMKQLACYIFFWDGKVRVVSKVGGTATTIAIGDIEKTISLVPNENYASYVKLSTMMDWGDFAGAMQSDTKVYTEENGVELEYLNSMVLSGNGFLDKLSIDPGGSSLFGDGVSTLAESGSDTELTDEDENFYTEEIETGMVCAYNNDGTTSGLAGCDSSSIIESVAYNGASLGSTVGFLPSDGFLSDGYVINRRPSVSGSVRVHKVKKLVEKIGAAYWSLFKNPDKTRIGLIGIDKYKNIYKEFDWGSVTYRAERAVVKFQKDLINFTFLEV